MGGGLGGFYESVCDASTRHPSSHVVSPISGHLMKVGNGVLIMVEGRLEMSTWRRRTEPRRGVQGQNKSLKTLTVTPDPTVT